MSQPTYPTAASARMPMPGGSTQLRLIKAFESHDSLYQLGQEIPRLADELDQAAQSRQPDRLNIVTDSTSIAIRADPAMGWPMMILLLSMGRDAIRSIIMGTVAHDAANGGVEWYPNPQQLEKEAGVYVVGLEHANHRGEFLNNKELRRLVKGLERYLEDAKTMSAGGSSVWVQNVDDALELLVGQRPATVARFASKHKDEMVIRELIRGLEDRITPLDPTGDVRHHQSPLYVGCSADLYSSMSDYALTQESANANGPLALTLSVLHALGIRMKLVPRVAIRVWEDGQLPIAEQLVTTLAMSLLSQTGLNAVEAGGTSGSDIPAASLTDGQDVVMQRHTFLSDNLDGMDEEMETREAAQEELARINKEMDLIDARLDSIDLDAIAQGPHLPALCVELRRLEALAKERLKQLEEMERKSRFVAELITLATGGSLEDDES